MKGTYGRKEIHIYYIINLVFELDMESGAGPTELGQVFYIRSELGLGKCTFNQVNIHLEAYLYSSLVQLGIFTLSKPELLNEPESNPTQVRGAGLGLSKGWTPTGPR